MDNDAQIKFCELIEDYGFFPSLPGNGVVWNIAVFPRTGKEENLLKSAQQLNINMVPDYKQGPRIRKTKECFTFSVRDFPGIVSMIERSVKKR